MENNFAGLQNSKKRVLDTTQMHLPEVLDVEDIVARSASDVGTSGRLQVVHNSARNLIRHAEGDDDVELASLDEVQTGQDLAVWLKGRKSLWRGYRQSRFGKQRSIVVEQKAFGRTTSDVLSGLRNDETLLHESVRSIKRPMGIDDLVKSAAHATTHGTWQIVEIQETDLPGSFVVWAFTSANQLHRIYLNVPRTLYFNCHDSLSKTVGKIVLLGGKAVKKVLPHDKPTLNLYEVEISESNFIRDEKAIELILSDPKVEGVYEAKVPLSFRAIINLGCLASVINPGICFN